MRALLVGAAALASATFAFAGAFAKAPTLSVGVKGQGHVTSGAGINCPGKCSASVRKGKKVTLKAKAAAGWKFARWGFACSGQRSSCSLKMAASKRVGASFVEKRQAPQPPPPPPPPPPPLQPPPPPPPPTPGFTPDLVRGTWSGSWNDARFNTTGPASIVVTAPNAKTFHLEATFEGAVFGCGRQPTVSADVAQGPGGANQWNAIGFAIDFAAQDGGSASLNHTFSTRTLDGHGTPGCRPTVRWVLIGAFNTGYTSFNGSVTTTLEDLTTAPALLSLTKGS